MDGTDLAKMDSTTAQVTIESLPTELLARVCEHLDHTHPQSLVAFSRVDKACHAIAASVLYRTIKLSFFDAYQMETEARKWETILNREDAFKHVRRLLIIQGDGHINVERQRLRSDYALLDPCERHEDPTGLRAPWDVWVEGHEKRNGVVKLEPVREDIWSVVMGIVERLTGLTDLFYACYSMFPSCLLRLLHEHIPQCRIHQYNMAWPLGVDPDTLPDLGIVAFANGPNVLRPMIDTVATSPSLHSVGDGHRKGAHRIYPPRIEWNSAGLLAGLRGPNVKEAHLHAQEIASIEEGDARTIPGTGSSHDSKTETPPALLEVLHIEGKIPLILAEVSTTLVCDNFSALRVLRIDPQTMDLATLPPAHNFPALATLSFTCALDPQTEYWDTLSMFLYKLPRLTTLQLRHWNREISLVPSLNSNLRRLDFDTDRSAGADGPSALFNDHVYNFAELCPDLEELSLEIRRSRGDAIEVSMYRALGELPRLRRLTLNLQVGLPGLSRTVEHLDAYGDRINHGTAADPWFDDEDKKMLSVPFQPYRQGHLRDLFVNCAVDADLARSIFLAVQDAKDRLPGPGVLPLERLEIKVSTGSLFEERLGWEAGTANHPIKIALRPYLSRLRRGWVVERDIRYDARDVIHVKETKLYRKHCWLEDHMRDTENWAELLGVWQKVWPFRELEHDDEESVKFDIGLDGWKSWPLADPEW